MHAVGDQGFYSRMPDVLAVMLRTNMPMRRPMRRPTTAARPARTPGESRCSINRESEHP